MPEAEHAQRKVSVRAIITPEPSRREKIIAVLVLALTLIGVSILATKLLERANATREDTIQDRIAVLSSSLEDAASIIAEIEREVNNRMKLVSDLEQRARVAKQLQEANREQVVAISLLLRGELDRQENWNFWVNAAQNTFFMILGAFLGHFVERWMSRRRQTRTR